MKDLNKMFIVFLLFLFFSCGKEKDTFKTNSEIQFRYYNLENSGWKSRKHTKHIDNIQFNAIEVPIQYFLLKDQGNVDLIKVDSIYEEHKSERVIEFTFQDDNEEDLLNEKFTQLDYASSVKYMSFKIQDDFYVVTSKNDTVQCSGVLFERSFKISPYNKVLLFFSNINPNDKIQLVYHDNLYKKGILKFRFKEPIINL